MWRWAVLDSAHVCPLFQLFDGTVAAALQFCCGSSPLHVKLSFLADPGKKIISVQGVKVPAPPEGIALSPQTTGYASILDVVQNSIAVVGASEAVTLVTTGVAFLLLRGTSAVTQGPLRLRMGRRRRGPQLWLWSLQQLLLKRFCSSSRLCSSS